MNSTLEMLGQLEAEGRVIGQRATAPMVDGKSACKVLEKTLEKFRAKQNAIKLDRPKLDPLRVWVTFEANQHDWTKLNKLELRTLFCAEETAMKRAFIEAIERSPELLSRSRYLYALVHNYFLVWRVMEKPVAVEQLLQNGFKQFKGKNPVVKKWAANAFLFSEKAIETLSSQICASQLDLEETLKGHNIGLSTRLAMELRASVAKAAGRIFEINEKAKGQEWALRYLRWVTERVFSDLTLLEAFWSTMGVFILSHSASKSEPFREALMQYIQGHKKLGDPRLRECALNWRSMPPEAAQQFLSWLAKKSIIFFFNTILPDNSENQRRKDFWLKYHKGIKDFQVAVSYADHWKIKASQSGQEKIAYSRVEHATASAFLMQFEGYGKKYLVVEFSETGNAAYIFHLADFERRGVSLRTATFQLKNHLKFDTTERIIHKGQWEIRAAAQLARDFGIRP